MSENYVFDEDKALEFIRNYVGEKISAQYSDDEILYIIDIIWDYYEKKGYLSLSAVDTDEEILDEDDLIAYVKKEIAKDKELIMDPSDIGKIIKGELEYEESLEDFV
ncbi:MAG: hypothetical protein K2H86_06435 [Muribaculaceae bacterium]|nr:hypothetical protein [Muribaculaceae bacterium]